MLHQYLVFTLTQERKMSKTEFERWTGGNSDGNSDQINKAIELDKLDKKDVNGNLAFGLRLMMWFSFGP